MHPLESLLATYRNRILNKRYRLKFSVYPYLIMFCPTSFKLHMGIKSSYVTALLFYHSLHWVRHAYKSNFCHHTCIYSTRALQRHHNYCSGIVLPRLEMQLSCRCNMYGHSRLKLVNFVLLCTDCIIFQQLVL